MIFSTNKPDCLSHKRRPVRSLPSSYAAIVQHPLHQAGFVGDAIFCAAYQCQRGIWQVRQCTYLRPEGSMLRLESVGDFDAEPAPQNRLEFTCFAVDTDLSAEDDRVQPRHQLLGRDIFCVIGEVVDEDLR